MSANHNSFNESHKSAMSRHKPTGIAHTKPTPNIDPGRSRRRFIARALAKVNTTAGKARLTKELLRLRKGSRYWCRAGNLDGVAAEVALLIAILNELQDATWQSTATLKQLSETAGLNTPGGKGCDSIHRASRAATRLHRLNIIRAEKAGFRPHLKTCEIRYIDVTEKFFSVMGISLKEAKRCRARGAGEPIEEADNVTENHPKLIADYLAQRKKMAEPGLIKLKAERERVRQLTAIPI